MPRVYLHIGEPKTGTTHLQHSLRTQRTALAANGVRVAGTNQHAVFRATQDLRGIEPRSDDPARPWRGEWDELAASALAAPRVSVISHELLCAADEVQAAYAVRSLAGADVHVVLTVRDIASLLPAEWQESVKHRSTRSWDDWLADVLDAEWPAADRGTYWFWRVHDTMRILRTWASLVPPGHVHVVPVPPTGADRDELWRRFACVLGVPVHVGGTHDAGGDSTSPDGTEPRANSSLGPAEVELLRRLNGALSEDVPGWYYMAQVKEPLAHGVLARRPRSGRLTLPAERHGWARAYASDLIAGIRQDGYPVAGDLDDLLPGPAEPGTHPDEVGDTQLLDVAVAATAALLQRRYHRMITPAGRSHRLGELTLDVVRSSPGLRHALYAAGDRSAIATRIRQHVRRKLETAQDTPEARDAR